MSSFSIKSLLNPDVESRLSASIHGKKQKTPLCVIISGMSDKLSQLNQIKKTFKACLISQQIIQDELQESSQDAILAQFKKLIHLGTSQSCHIIVQVEENNFSEISSSIPSNYRLEKLESLEDSDLLQVRIESLFDELERKKGESVFENFDKKDFQKLRKSFLRMREQNVLRTVSMDFNYVISANDVFESRMREYDPFVDRSMNHRPYIENEFQHFGASIIRAQELEPTCPNFIATPAPNERTLHNFWQMVEASKSNLIVMLADNVDAKGNSVTYWPLKVGEEMDVGPYKIKHINQSKILQGMKESLFKSTLELIKGTDTRLITQFRVRHWDDGCAIKDRSILIDLLDQVREFVENDPNLTPIVHCWAGAGRTGLFIASYLARLFMIWKGSDYKIDYKTLPLEIALFLRYERHLCLHTLDQYRALSSLIDHFSFQEIVSSSDDDG